MIVVFYFDNSKQKLDSEVLNANTNHELNIPKKCEYVQFAIKIKGKLVHVKSKNYFSKKKNIYPQKIFS